ncbi:carboxynorspermidine decarboxylase [Dyadobacter sp. BE34]|uniref:Carboxynorspermidine/carboxyspermidine decarboxylase n=1 Tax=Dyadobacter fermentans TaxID=94254 RepID=A0ABU1QX30_9BACT|nr:MULTISPECIES: carboxynorspermidine decarboxylase [Dyadobacter]MDR6805707.1 carboxynorspermidine decarboxylase [Dyadobacter fermentans]MDR7042533.1 carboxynorspermidine decarboxylase [Dyadobacter sp. BE242]MDR7196845.1 carboxynorspermidine decarboxylase [Dyadobacter sp. BE34]MDR7215720.1 carboxynorspermidine decarboxylase [Dyadobacter sp. BE31]MDR7263256.1 carboxynorspermidine decarboxylase [Dyadobacter sp. BE32]
MAIDFKEIPSPCFVLEEELLRKNLELIDSVQKAAGCQIILALKGFSMYSAFPIVKEYLSGATASSLNEVKLINDFMGYQSHTYMPAYLDSEFEEIMQRSSHITFNSLSQWERFQGRVEAYKAANPGKTLSCGIRVNPQYSEVATDMYNPCVPGSRLGVTRDKLPDELPVGIDGIHFHTLCENGSDTLERTLAALEERFGDLLHQAKWLNMGGGHLMTREGYDISKLIKLVSTIEEKYNLEVILEPGSAIAWRTGILYTTVLDVLDSQGIDVAILDTSFAAHMPDTLEMPYKPAIRGAYQEPVEGKPTYRLGGMTCLAGDYMGDYSFDKSLEIGDRIIFEDMIHYTMVKTTTFNGVNLPSIGIWKADQKFQLVRSYGYESFKDRLS